MNPTAKFTVDITRILLPLISGKQKFGLSKFKSLTVRPKSFLNTPGALEPLKRSKVIIKAVQFWSIVLLRQNPTWIGRSQWSQLTKPARLSFLSGSCPKAVTYTDTFFDAALRHCRCPGTKATELMKGLRRDDDFQGMMINDDSCAMFCLNSKGYLEFQLFYIGMLLPRKESCKIGMF